MSALRFVSVLLLRNWRTTDSLACALLMLTFVLKASPPADIDKRIEDLLRRMTIEEKLGQMSQSTSMKTLTDEFRQEIRAGRWGSFLNAGSPADRAEAQRIALKESRLGIPLIFGRDVIHGYKTIFPIPLGQAASWDADLIAQAARMAAREAAGEGIQWTFAPMIDIARDPRWGRVAESLGEDPYLTGVLGAAMVRGFQGNALNEADSLAACAKHYAGYGAAEAGRDYNSAWLPEILLRDVYLPPFKAAKDAGVASFMTAFNTVNAVPATANGYLLRDILRDEWGFNGLVVTDYEAVTNLIAHGFALDPRDAARKSILAGAEMEMVSTAYYDHLKSLVESRQVDIKLIDNAVRDVLRLKFRLGLFDGRAQGTASAEPAAQSLETAQRLAEESAVLLLNKDEVLPLSKSIGKIAVIGPLADSPVDQMGTWVMDGRAADVHTPLRALRDMLGGDRVLYAPGLKNSRDTSHDGFAAAIDAARQADAVVLFLGEEQILSGEARSRAFLNLPGAQDALVEEIAKAGKKTVAVIMAGRPLTFHEAAGRVNALLYAWHPGTMGGPAIARLLFGDEVPSGKLTITFPRTVGQVPIYYAHLTTGRPALESELGVPLGNPANPQGYTSKYIDVDFTPEYSFGYGLSYTKFTYSAPRLSSALLGNGSLTVSADVTNAGNHEADEIVQLYVNGPFGGSVARPVRELKGFERVHLKPGERKTVTFTLSKNSLAYYHGEKQFSAEPGAYKIWVSPDSVSGTPAGFSIE